MVRKLLSALFVLVVFSGAALAQSGALKGKVTDKASGAEIPFATVVVELNGSMLGSVQTIEIGLCIT